MDQSVCGDEHDKYGDDSDDDNDDDDDDEG